MQIPTSDLSSDRLELLGLAHLTALAADPEVADLVAVFQPAQDLLGAAAARRIAAERSMVAPRVTLRFVERRCEAAVRRVAAAAEAADGKRKGARFTELFPNGLTAELRPRSAGQLAALRRVHDRLTQRSTLAALRTEHEAALTEAIAALEGALAAREAAAQAFGTAYAAELATREDWIRAYDASAGAIRQRFPRDRERQDLYFDPVRTAARRHDDEEPTDPAAS